MQPEMHVYTPKGHFVFTKSTVFFSEEGCTWLTELTGYKEYAYKEYVIKGVKTIAFSPYVQNVHVFCDDIIEQTQKEETSDARNLDSVQPL